MATSLPSPPSTPTPSPCHTASLDPSLVSRLDDLLATYLSLLDTYSSLRARLSSDLSSGFLFLAHANRNATFNLGAGRRYGEEGFDGRMKASRGVRISQSKGSETQKKVEEDRKETDESKAVAGEEQKPEERIDPAEAPQVIDSLPSHFDYTAFTTLALLQPGKKDNPLRWYGLLVPPALRQCQSTFTSSMTSSVPALLTVMSQMRALEAEIWAVREDLGILDDYDHPLRTRQGEEVEAETASKPNSSSKKGISGLVSRSTPPEPRSRVLKMD